MTFRTDNQYIVEWYKQRVTSEFSIIEKKSVIGWYETAAWWICFDENLKNEKRYQLTDFFEDWQNPNEDEVTLFELETGCKYLTELFGIEPIKMSELQE